MARTPPPRPRRKNDPAALRRRVLDAAAEMFQARGYHASAMHDLAAAAGVTSGALHHHFATKKALGLAVIGERVGPEVAASWIEPVARAPSGPAGVAQAMAAIAAALDQRGAVRGCPLNNLVLELSLADPDFRAAMAQVFEAWRGAIAARLEADGRPAEEAARLAGFTVAAYSGAMAMAKAQQSTAPLKDCAEELARVLGR